MKDVSLTAAEAAIEISAWYVDEYIKLFSKQQELDMSIQMQMSFIGG